MNRVDARVVWRHSVAHVGGNTMFLKKSIKQEGWLKATHVYQLFNITSFTVCSMLSDHICKYF